MSKGTLLAVDPATRSGWAWYDGGKLRDFGAVQTTAREARDILCAVGSCGVIARGGRGFRPDAVVTFTRTRGTPPTLAIEEHTIPRNRRTSRLLIENRMRWECAAEAMGWRVERVNSQTWQRVMVGLGTSAQRKAHAVELAHGLVRRDIGVAWDRRPNADEADAICLGSYWLRTNAHVVP